MSYFIPILLVVILLIILSIWLVMFLIGSEYYGDVDIPQNLKDKAWIHKCQDDIERFIVVQDDYNGFEIDLFYDSEMKDFVVSHGPNFPFVPVVYEKTYKGEILLFSTFYKEIYNKKAKIWIDYKNPNISTYKESCDILNTIVTDKANVYVEIYNYTYSYEISQYFKSQGYKIILNIDDFIYFINSFYKSYEYDGYAIGSDVYYMFHSLFYHFNRVNFFVTKGVPHINYMSKNNDVGVFLTNKWLKNDK